MEVTFTLSSKDLAHFRSVLVDAREATKSLDEDEVLASAQQMLDSTKEIEVPDFVAVRLEILQRLIDMMRDEEWALPARDRRRVRNALSYFIKADDLIPDTVPGIGLLDDAIMIELVLGGVQYEIDAYNKFCELRDDKAWREAILTLTEAERKKRIKEQRTKMHKDMHDRRKRGQGKKKGGSGLRASFW